MPSASTARPSCAHCRSVSRNKLAELVGVSKSYIWALENKPVDRAQRTSATVMNGLAKALGVTL